jgi:hypothetical protein
MMYNKKEHVPSMERTRSKKWFHKIEGNVFPGFPLRCRLLTSFAVLSLRFGARRQHIQKHDVEE